MRIKKVSLYRKEMPMACGKFSCSLEPGIETADVVITRVETECGLVGYGEAGSVGGYPNYALGTLASSAELIERHLMQKDPGNLNDIQYTMSLIDGHGAIKAGFDMACWDILGKATNKPLHAMLGGKLHEKVAIYRSIPTIEPKAMVQSVQDWRDEGYCMFQLRVGMVIFKPIYNALPGSFLNVKKANFIRLMLQVIGDVTKPYLFSIALKT